MLMLVLALSVSCKPVVTREVSPLIDDLSGVWLYPKELTDDPNDEKTALVIDNRSYAYYDYSNQHGYERSRSGNILGQEGVYFFPNEASYYSPKFFVKRDGKQFLILNRLAFERYVKDDRIDLLVLIRVSDKLDMSNPPQQPSIESLGLPYDNPFLE